MAWMVSYEVGDGVGYLADGRKYTERVWQVTAEHPTGLRFEYAGPVKVNSRRDAEGLVDRINAFKAKNRWRPRRRYWRELATAN